MKLTNDNINKILSKISVILIFVLLTFFNSITGQVIINPNGSFETSCVTVGEDTNAVEGWTFNIGGDADASFRIVDDVVKDGNRALSIKVWNIGSNAWDIEALSNPLTVALGETYTYCVWAKADEEGATAHFTVGGPPPNYTEHMRNSQNTTLTTEWQLFTGEFIIPSNFESEEARGPIHFNFSENIDKTIYIDSLRITQVTGTDDEQDPIAKGKDKFLGNIYSSSQLPRFTEYWNQVTPENGGKWGSVEGTRDVMNWSSLDAAYNLAKDNGFPFRFHVLIWGNQQPSWIESLDASQQWEEIEEWFNAVATRYDDIDYLEVVNEPLHDPPNQPGNGGGNYIEALGGDGVTGWDWVITAFELARDYFPNTKLIINEYSVVNENINTTNYIEIIELLQAEDLIDGIGVQGHAFSTRGSTTTMKSNLDRLAATGLPIQVTEMDIDGPTDEEQLEDYQRIFPTFWEHPNVEGITLWGWKPGCWRTEQKAYLMTSTGEERPALEWLRAYVDTSTATAISDEDSQSLNTSFVLYDNYPNPFNPRTTIRYTLPVTRHINLSVYNLLGKKVATLVDDVMQTGHHSVDWDAENVSSGVYFYHLEADGYSSVKKMMLMK